METNIKILVACHKKDIYHGDCVYMPIQVGKDLSNVDLEMQGDNTGENISYKNGNYCELTAMYWAWKNLKNVDYIGLCHYRRYFDFHSQALDYYPKTCFSNEYIDKLNFDIPTSVIALLKQGKAIVPKKIIYKGTIFHNYCGDHYSKDIRIIKNLIWENGDEKYKKAFWDVMFKNNKLHPANMFIMSWEQFDKFCNWLFDILSRLEDRIDISWYTPYQKRIYGFISERLLNVFFKAEDIDIKEYPIIYFGEDVEPVPSRLRYTARCAARNFCNWLLKEKDVNMDHFGSYDE